MGGTWHTLIARLSGREADYIFIKLSSARTRNQGIDLARVMAAPNGEIRKANGVSPHLLEGEEHPFHGRRMEDMRKLGDDAQRRERQRLAHP